ncbi:MAG: VOC family protein [Pseudomonadales bacterium]|nr:VOC family protein [Pseudomonadales bacterium]MCP5182980.1 VOC family protein [Pseudomonadales bacterium]
MYLPLAQTAYFVPDIRKAALDAHRRFGAGPFFVVSHIELSKGTHRGKDCPFVHSSAYGQWGDVMMELVQQESDGPSPFRDMFAPGESGLHHMAAIVPDQQAAYAHYRQTGLEVVTIAHTLTGTEFAFVDARATLGHMIEVYQASPGLLGFYAMVKEAAQGWDGSDPVRELNR